MPAPGYIFYVVVALLTRLWAPVFVATIVWATRAAVLGVSPKRVRWPEWSVHTLWLIAVYLASTLTIVGLLWMTRRTSGARREVVRGSAAVAVGILVGTIVVPVGSELAAGSWVAAQWFAPLVRAAPSVAAGGAVSCLLYAYVRVIQAGGLRRYTIFLIATTGLGGLVLAADLFVAPGRFERAHAVLWALAGLYLLPLFEVAVQRGFRAGSSPSHPPQPLSVVAAGMLVAVFVAALMGVRDISRPEIRADIALRNPVGEGLDRLLGPVEQTDFVVDAVAQLAEQAATPTIAPPMGMLRPIAPDGEPWNVLLFVVDALRGDAIWPLRDETPFHAWMEPGDTPFLDEWTKSTFSFTHVYAGASATHRSMPSMFRSLPCSLTGPNIDYGTSLPRAARAAGLSPIAFVNDYFSEPRYVESHQLLDGFDRVQIYNESQPQSAMRDAVAFLEQSQAEPFFAWIHFYGLHDPYFDGSTFLGTGDGSWGERYKRAMPWFDTQFQLVIEGLERLGMAEHTIVVLASDHGEALGANRIATHSVTVAEEEIRVPLHIHIPGLSGRVMRDVVGNIDILPTLWDLLGTPLPPSYAGETLVPLMVGSSRASTSRYYAENGYSNKRQAALIRGSDKLTYQFKGRLFRRFDLVDDPLENENLYHPQAELDRELMQDLLAENPQVFAAELRRRDVRPTVALALRQIRVDVPSDELDALLRIAQRARGKAVTREVLRLFDRATSEIVRAKAARLGSALAVVRTEKRMVKHLHRVRHTPAEGAFVSALADAAQPAFARSLVAKRVHERATTGTLAELEPWLRLVHRWSGNAAAEFGPGLAEALLRAHQAGEGHLIALSLESIRGLDGVYRQNALLTTTAEQLLNHEDTSIARAAGYALAVVGTAQSAKRLLLRLEDSRLLMRQAALHGLAGIQGPEVLPLLERLATDEPLLTMDVIVIAEKLGGDRAVRLLDRIATQDSNQLLRWAAEHASRRAQTKPSRARQSRKTTSARGAAPPATPRREKTTDVPVAPLRNELP